MNIKSLIAAAAAVSEAWALKHQDGCFKRRNSKPSVSKARGKQGLNKSIPIFGSQGLGYWSQQRHIHPRSKR